MLNITDRTNTYLHVSDLRAHRRSRRSRQHRKQRLKAVTAAFRALDEQIAFIDMELSWVSSDSIADSLEATRRELFAERFPLIIPATR